MEQKKKKEIELVNGFIPTSLFDEQETIEVAAENYSIYNEQVNKAIQEAVKFGANWQSKRMYSEEDLKEAFKGGNKTSWIKKNSFEEWFQQFKKK